MTKPYEQEIKSIRTPLFELHRLLLSILKKKREQEMGVQALNAAEWFQILLNAPEYAWLKVLNSFISDVDALSESDKVSPQDMAILRAEVDRLFFKDDEDVTSFNSHYRKLFANHHDVMYVHGHLKKAFSNLPNGDMPPENAEEVRRGWHKTGVSKRKLMN